MQEIYSEKYILTDRQFEIVGFRDKEKVRIKIYEITDQKRVVISKFEAAVVMDAVHDVAISKTNIFQQFVKAAKHFLKVYTTSR